MARIQADVQLDPERAPEQLEFLRERVTILREAAGRYRVSLEESQVETLAAAGMEVYADADAGIVTLPSVTFRPASEVPEPPAALAAAEPTGEDTTFYLVHFKAPIDKAWLNDIATVGGEFMQAVPYQAAVFRFSREEADAVRAREYVDALLLYHPAFAVGLRLAGVEEPFSASSLRNLVVQAPPESEGGNLRLSVFDALDPEELREPLEAAGATIVADIAQGFQVNAPADRVERIISVPGIFSADVPVVERLMNNNAGVIVGTNQVRSMGTVNFLVNLDGRGEVGAVVDSGFDLGDLAGADPPGARPFTAFHADLVTNIRLLRNRLNPQNAALRPRDAAPHGTHVAGTIAGDGSNSGGQVRGMAPGASLIGLGAAFGGPAMNVNVPFEFAFQNGARVINNSWGSGFSGAPTNNDYRGTEARPVDRWCFNHPDVLVLFAAGNDEGDLFPPGGNGTLDARTLGLEASAKNILTVGATENLRNNGGIRDSYRTTWPGFWNHGAFNALAGGPGAQFRVSDNADHVVLFSDRGRVRDAGSGNNTRRIKPDICAPGTNVLSCRSQWVAPPPPLPGVISVAFYNNNTDSMLPAGLNRSLYQILSGTSMATPIVSGAALLVRQYYRTRFAQMRRPLLLEGVAIPAAAPLPVFGERLAVSAHADGLVFTWVTPELPANPKRIVGMRFSRRLAPVDVAPVVLQTAVGDRPAVRVATRGDRTYVLHRHADDSLRLSCYNRTLAPEAAFGTAGVVTVAAGIRPDDRLPPDLLVEGEHLVCLFPPGGGSGFAMQRFRADTGAAVDAAPIVVLTDAEDTGPHGTISRATQFLSAARYSVCGVHPGNNELHLRQIRDDGTLFGTAPIVLVDRAADIREPNMIFDRRNGRHVIVWCDATNQPNGEIFLQFADFNGNPVGAPTLVVTVPAANRVRRPRIMVNPYWGYYLAWEDDTQNAHFDLYLTLLNDTGQVSQRIPQDPNDPLTRRLIRISDTPEDTAGFAAAVDGAGLTMVYQSPDEINSDRMGVYALNLTESGAFEAQEDPSTPLQRSGSYVPTDMIFHIEMQLTALSAVWAGGSWYLLRLNVTPPLPSPDSLEWVRLTADGTVDVAYAVNGVRGVPINQLVTGCEILWTGSQMITAANDQVGGISVFLQDQQGAPAAAFGVGGTAALVDAGVVLDPQLPPHVGFFNGPLRVTVGYGIRVGAALHLRYQRIDDHGVRIGNAVDLAEATGVARHGWFQSVTSEQRSIAIYHRVNGADTRVHCRRFQINGTPDGAERNISAAAGEGTNGVLARRPTLVNSPQREYGAAWQYRVNNASHWEIRFSRLDRLGRPMANPPLPAPPITDVPVVAAGADWPADRDAVEPQLLSTYTHERVTSNAPASTWTPSYGLAWIGVYPDGSRVLFFTALDANGQRLTMHQPPPVAAGPLNPPVPVPLLQISATGSNVRDFKLVWNGRVFLLYWVEEERLVLRHHCMIVSRYASVRVHDAPSAALIRATLVNGATNITPALTPGSVAHSIAGYGWGRLNLRQTLSPAPPVTLYVRDDCALGPGGIATYHFTVPPGSALLRVTLNWTDPPGAWLVNRLHLTVRAPAAPAPPHLRPEYRGNLWDAAAGRTHLSRPTNNPPTAADNHEDFQIYKQVVIDNPVPGDYQVEVSAAVFPADAFNQQNLQPFALVFAATGPEVRFARPVADVQAAAVY